MEEDAHASWMLRVLWWLYTLSLRQFEELFFNLLTVSFFCWPIFFGRELPLYCKHLCFDFLDLKDNKRQPGKVFELRQQRQSYSYPRWVSLLLSESLLKKSKVSFSYLISTFFNWFLHRLRRTRHIWINSQCHQIDWHFNRPRGPKIVWSSGPQLSKPVETSQVILFAEGRIFQVVKKNLFV